MKQEFNPEDFKSKDIVEGIAFSSTKEGEKLMMNVVATKKDISEYTSDFLITIINLISDELVKRDLTCDDPDCEDCNPHTPTLDGIKINL
jgi:hypothetical protein